MPDETTTTTATTEKPAEGTTEKTTTETTTTEKPAATTTTTETTAAKPAAEIKYDLKLPENSNVDPALTERTAALARTLGLSPESAQKTLDAIAQEVSAQSEARVQSALSEWSAPSKELPDGGPKWKEHNESQKALSLADKDLGNGNPDQLQKSAELAKQVVAKFGDEETVKFFETTGLGSNPATLKFLTRIGKAMSEGTLVKPTEQGTTRKSDSEVFYPSGAGRTKEQIAASTG